MSQGIIVAADAAQEWLLPIFWHYYCQYNSYPITFVDFGLSRPAQEWCQERGRLLCLSCGLSLEEDPSQIAFWQTIYRGSFSSALRTCWHQKPLAMQLSPYHYTLWLDLDCQLRGSLAPLFSMLMQCPGLLLCPESSAVQARLQEKGELLPGEILFNSGVVGFSSPCPYIAAWAEQARTESCLHVGDQNLLSRLIYRHQWKVQEIPAIYNFPGTVGTIPDEVVIVHYLGEMGKFLLSLEWQKLVDSKKQ